MATAVQEKRLFRVREGAYAGGVCAGMAERFNVDAIVVRILAVLLALLTFGAAAIVYIALWVQLPVDSGEAGPFDVTPESAESSAFGCFDCDSLSNSKHAGGIPIVARLAVAAGLMVLFLAVATGVSPLMPGTQWWQFWPLALLMAGLCLIVIPVRTRFEAVWHAIGIMVTAAAASMLPMSLGVMSWQTVSCAFGEFWPAVIVAATLFAVGFFRQSRFLLLAAAFCFVAFCLAGIVLCVVPGELESLLLFVPSGRSFEIAIVG